MDGDGHGIHFIFKALLESSNLNESTDWEFEPNCNFVSFVIVDVPSVVIVSKCVFLCRVPGWSVVWSVVTMYMWCPVYVVYSVGWLDGMYMGIYRCEVFCAWFERDRALAD